METQTTTHLADCFDILPTIEQESINLVLCDLPYKKTSMKWDELLPIDKLWEQYKRILKPTGCVLLFGNQPMTSTLVMSNLEWFKQALVWNKNRCGSPVLARVRPMQIHEDILVFAPSTTTYNPIMMEGEPYSRTRRKGRVNNFRFDMDTEGSYSNIGTRYPRSIIDISRDFQAQQQVHPTQKPVTLLNYLIKTYSNEGELILDNCMGSGSTGVAALQCNRSFIGIEKEAEYYLIAKQRINEQIATNNLQG